MRGKSATPTVAIDPDRLKETIRNHNYTVHDLSTELGYGHSYLSRFTSGSYTQMPKRTVALLETVGIHYEDFKATTKEVKVAPVNQPITTGVLTVHLDDEQFAQLAVMIREQVYESMKRICGIEQ